MKNVMGIIYTGEKDNFLRELTMKRSIAAMPLAGRFRVIDFLVSSLVNSGVRNVGVIMQKNYHSLMDHLGSGKEWDLHGKNDGLYILPPFLNRDNNLGTYSGTLDGLHSNMGYLRRSKQEYVLLSNSLMVYNVNFTDFYNQFIQSESEIMLMYSKDQELIRSEFGMYIDVTDEGQVVDIEIAPTKPRYTNSCMEVYLMRKELLLDLIDRGTSHGLHDFNRDMLQRLIQDTNIKVSGYEYKGKVFRIDSITSYFQCNMDMLNTEIRHKVFAEEMPVYTKLRDELPERYCDSALMSNCIVADGGIVEGNVSHSVLFRGVKIAKGAVVKNCIIMQDSVIEENAYLENCILDKQAVIQKNTRLIGPSSYPIVISKNMVI